MLRYFSSRSFGVEIETFGLKYTSSLGAGEVIPPYQIMTRSPEGQLLPQVFQRQGLSLDGFSPQGLTYENWCFVKDDSIKGAGGSELVSPVLHGVKGLAQVYDALLLLQEIPGIQVNETCGFHVHHGVDPLSFGSRELKNLVKIMAMFEGYLYHLLPEERRRAETCRPMEIDLYEWFRGDDLDQAKKLWYSPLNRDDATPSQRRYHPTRYHGLNLHSYWYRGTIEFRYFPPLLDQPEEFMQWIIFTQFLVELSAGRRPVLEFIPQPNKWLNMLYKVYLGHGLMDHIRYAIPSPAPREDEL